MANPLNHGPGFLLHQTARLVGVDLRAVGTQVLVPPQRGCRWIPQFCYLYLRSLTGGVLTTAPVIRIGSNAAHTNVAPAFAPPLGVAPDVIGLMPLAAPLKAPDIDTLPILFEVQTAAVGPAEMTGDVLLIGISIKTIAGWP